MTKKTKTDPLPEIKDLDTKTTIRLLTSEYLYMLGDLVKRGDCQGFDLVWSDDLEKPVGNVLLSSFQLRTTLEVRLREKLAQMRQEHEAQAQTPKIEFTDGSQHEKCKDPKCFVCNSPIKA